ncbi:MAG: EamA family transporter [Dysgonomonas sp.]
MWKYYAVLSAIFASLTAVFAKIGIKNVDSNLATAIRTCVILLITWGIVFVNNGADGVKGLTKMNWIFLILSGAATGLSWLFYFKALQLGDASKVAPIDKLSVVFTIFLSFIILKETVSWKVILGGLFIAGGSLVILLDKQ